MIVKNTLAVILVAMGDLVASSWRSLPGYEARAIGVLGFVFGIVVHATGVMVQYDVWVHIGMPPRNPYFQEILLTCTGAMPVVIAIIAVVHRMKKVEIN